MFSSDHHIRVILYINGSSFELFSGVASEDTMIHSVVDVPEQLCLHEKPRKMIRKYHSRE